MPRIRPAVLIYIVYPVSKVKPADQLLSNKAMFPASRQFEAALQVVKDLRSTGHEAYLAGGCVRDLMLGASQRITT